MSRLFAAEVVAQRPIAERHLQLVVRAEGSLPPAVPGQFMMVACHPVGSAAPEPLLRRPLSIAGFDQREGTLEMIYRIQGRGTKALSRLAPRERISLLGPLGRGFTWRPGQGRPGLVGGGVGVPPLLFLAERMRAGGLEPAAFLGFGRRAVAFGMDRLAAAGVPVELATDDGSAGWHGRVTDLVAERARARQLDALYACGPVPMLAATAALAARLGLPCQLCLEALMGCGVGACLTCVWPVRKAGTDGPFAYRRVCRDGPVFGAEEVCFDADARPAP
ncbi:MAG TPA: dihydroorotate dehydrogenase electron transfer subunit [Limnochordia bacterium]